MDPGQSAHRGMSGRRRRRRLGTVIRTRAPSGPYACHMLDQSQQVGAGGHLGRRTSYSESPSSFHSKASRAACRLVVRRTQLTGAQATLWPDWRYHAFVTDRQGSPIELDADHRRHAVCELAIRDLNDGAGLGHCPSGRFLANAAWLVITARAHNLLRWTSRLGLGTSGLVVAKTLRRRLLILPGRLTRSARRWRLHLPTGWPWASEFTHAITRLRALPAAT